MTFIYFDDFPEFRPNLTPIQIFKMGSFGGTYWRDIESSVTNKKYKSVYTKYPTDWFDTIPYNYMVLPYTLYDKNVNKYKVKVGSTLQEWQDKDWISKYHPYGWVQWYCDFYLGERCPDDSRQIKRWLNLAGKNGRFRKSLVKKINTQNTTYNDMTVSPKIRQTLQHWGYRLAKKDMSR